MIHGRRGPWCQIGSRHYKGAPFDKAKLARKAVELQPLVLKLCAEADRDHKESKRQYCHVGVHGERVVCVATAFLKLPRSNRDGLLSHEAGHLLADPIGGEAAADAAFKTLTGVTIRYKDSPFGECLQYLRPEDSRKLEGLFEFDLSGLEKAKKSNPEYELTPADEQTHLPALPPSPLTPGQWFPPRVSFDLLRSGRVPFIYMPPGRLNQSPRVTDALARVLTRTGLASPQAWLDLFSAVSMSSAYLYVIDRHAERWKVVDVLLDFGSETGVLVLRHVGARSRGGDREFDIHKAYGHVLPVVVYRPARSTPMPNRGTI